MTRYSRRNERKMEQWLDERALREAVAPIGRCKGVRLADLAIGELFWLRKHARGRFMRRAIDYAIRHYKVSKD